MRIHKRNDNGGIKLSICIPTYNFGEFIGETLESIIGQAGDEVEVIVGDGASTDNTEDVVRACQSKFPNISYHKFEKKGGIDLDLVRTVGLAKGDYCWLLSSDDVLRPGAIRRVLNEIQSGHAIYLCNRTDCDRSLNDIAHRYWLPKKHQDGVFDFSNRLELLEYLKSAQSLGALFSYISSIIVRRAAWEGIGDDGRLMGSNYAHVYKLFSIAQHGGKVKYIQDSLVSTRLFNDSFMVNGIARRYLIDLNGYQSLADHLFVDNSVRDAFKSVMRKEHKWYFLAGLASKVKSRGEWDELVSKLRSYGYHPAMLYMVGKLGRSKRVMACARCLRRIL